MTASQSHAPTNRWLVGLLFVLTAAPAIGSDVDWTFGEESLVAPIAVAHPVALAAYDAPPLSPAGEPLEPVPAVIDDAQLVGRLAELEARQAELDEAHARLEKSLKRHARSGHRGATMQITGRIHLDLWGFPADSPGVNGFESGDPNVSPQDRIGFRRIRIDARGDLACNMAYKLELEFAGGDESEFRDTYLGWNDLPLLQTLLLGNQKRPYGLDHLNSSRFNVFLERPFVIESFNQDARRVGIQSYGVSDDKAWNWRYGLFNLRLLQDEGNYTSDHWQSEIAGRLANTFWWNEASGGRGYGHWAVSGSWADTDQNAAADNFAGSGASEARFAHRPEARSANRWLDTGVIADADDYTLVGLEGVLNVGPVQFVAEHQEVHLNRVGASQIRLHGSYAYVSYFLTGEHMPWDRERGVLGRIVPRENFFLVENRCGRVCRGLGAWQLAARWSYADFVDEDIFGGIGESLTLGLNWYWTPYARMQLNYLYGEIEQNDFNAPAGAPNFGAYQILGARFSVDF